MNSKSSNKSSASSSTSKSKDTSTTKMENSPTNKVLSKKFTYKSKTSNNIDSSKSKNTTFSSSTIGASERVKKMTKQEEKSKKSSLLSKNQSESNLLIKSKQVQMKIEDQTVVKCASMKDLNNKGFKVDISKSHDNLFIGQGNGKSMLIKLINLKLVTARYRKNLEKFSIKIIKFIGEKPLCKSFPKVYEIFLIEDVYLIFMEILDTKTLYDLVVEKHEIPIDKVQKWIKQLIEGVCILQKYGIAHRFIKLKHLLIDRDNIKILGWSKAVLFWDGCKDKALLQQKEKRIHKNNFLPPEAFNETYDPSKADVWSVGVVLVSLLTHHYPFHVRTQSNFVDQWKSFVKRHPINPVAKALCDKIFTINVKKRIKAGEMLHDRFFQIEHSKSKTQNFQEQQSFENQKLKLISEDKTKINEIKSKTSKQAKIKNKVSPKSRLIVSPIKSYSKNNNKNKVKSNVPMESTLKSKNQKSKSTFLYKLHSSSSKDNKSQFSSCNLSFTSQKSGFASKLSNSTIGASKASKASNDIISKEPQKDDELVISLKELEAQQKDIEADQLLQQEEENMENQKIGNYDEDIANDEIIAPDIVEEVGAAEDDGDDAIVNFEELEAAEETEEAANPIEIESREVNQIILDAASALNDEQEEKPYQSFSSRVQKTPMKN